MADFPTIPCPPAVPSPDLLGKSLVGLYRRLGGASVRDCTIEFYPYSRFSNTIRLRSGVLRVRLSDLLRNAPAGVQTAFAVKLVYKLSGRHVPKSVDEACRNWAHQPHVVLRERQLRRERGRKQIGPARGDVFDLERLFETLNRTYFSPAVHIARLGWGVRRSRRRLGHYDPAHDVIVINPRLDNPLVPEYVVSVILYHEMLHAFFSKQEGALGRGCHDRHFKQAEGRHPDRGRAQQFIQTHFSRSMP